MTEEFISADVRRFLLTSISSVPYLEALLLLRSEPEHSWDSRSMAQRLYIGDDRARLLLQELISAGIAAQTSQDPLQGRYQPALPELQRMLDAVADAYVRHLVEVTQLIHSKLDKKAQQFADAFKWRQDT